jgi:hypothetical protein
VRETRHDHAHRATCGIVVQADLSVCALVGSCSGLSVAKLEHPHALDDDEAQQVNLDLRKESQRRGAETAEDAEREVEWTED